MALKVLMLRRKITDKKNQLEELRNKSKEFQTRELELEQAITEANTQEEQSTVSALVSDFELEKAENSTQIGELETEINNLEAELAQEETRQNTQPTTKREEINIMPNKATKFFGLSSQERSAFFQQEAVTSFLERARELATQKRSVNGTDLLIPVVMLDLLRENIGKYSKLIERVRLKPVSGIARQNIMGKVPEAVWTDAIASLNEIDLNFGNVEVDGYKVGSYFALANSTLEDSDIALATELIDALGEAIGLAVDKAILYGKGIRMPLGIVTRLKQTSKPSDTSNKLPWKDLHESNIISISNAQDLELLKKIILASGAAKGSYSNGSIFWAMNKLTHMSLLSASLSANSSGAVVAGMNNSMPVIGGEIVELDFIPDGDIIGGYGDTYLLAERSGTSIAQSSEVLFFEDQTAFKGVARYDGLPVIAENFILINIKGLTPTTDMDFAQDVANNSLLEDIIIGNEELSPEFGSGVFEYSVTVTNSADEIVAIPQEDDAVISAVYNKKKIKNGSLVTWVEGESTLVFNIKNGSGATAYTVHVTK